jgi:hypothetical protein
VRAAVWQLLGPGTLLRRELLVTWQPGRCHHLPKEAMEGHGLLGLIGSGKRGDAQASRGGKSHTCRGTSATRGSVISVHSTPDMQLHDAELTDITWSTVSPGRGKVP